MRECGWHVRGDAAAGLERAFLPRRNRRRRAADLFRRRLGRGVHGLARLPRPGAGTVLCLHMLTASEPDLHRRISPVRVRRLFRHAMLGRRHSAGHVRDRAVRCRRTVVPLRCFAGDGGVHRRGSVADGAVARVGRERRRLFRDHACGDLRFGIAMRCGNGGYGHPGAMHRRERCVALPGRLFGSDEVLQASERYARVHTVHGRCCRRVELQRQLPDQLQLDVRRAGVWLCPGRVQSCRGYRRRDQDTADSLAADVSTGRRGARGSDPAGGRVDGVLRELSSCMDHAGTSARRAPFEA